MKSEEMVHGHETGIVELLFYFVFFKIFKAPIRGAA